MGKSHRNKGMYFKFGDMDTLKRFINLYGDLFVPYSEQTVQCESYVAEFKSWKPENKQPYTRGYHDEQVMEELRNGYKINPFKDDELLIRVNLFPEALKEILKSMCFEECIFDNSHRVLKRKYYVYKGEPA